MITFDPDYSRELCGGCHVQQTGSIGYFKITTETAVAAGVRRIEAATATGAEAYVAGLETELSSIKNVLKAKDLTKGIVALQEDNKQLQKTIERMIQEQANNLREGLRSKFVDKDGINMLCEILPISDTNAVKTLAAELEREIGNAVIAFGAVSDEGKPSLTIKISDELVKSKNLNAGTIVRELAQKHLKGGGGGQPGFATAGGTDSSGLGAAMEAVEAMF